VQDREAGGGLHKEVKKEAIGGGAGQYSESNVHYVVGGGSCDPMAITVWLVRDKESLHFLARGGIGGRLIDAKQRRVSAL